MHDDASMARCDKGSWQKKQMVIWIIFGHKTECAAALLSFRYPSNKVESTEIAPSDCLKQHALSEYRCKLWQAEVQIFASAFDSN